MAASLPISSLPPPLAKGRMFVANREAVKFLGICIGELVTGTEFAINMVECPVSGSEGGSGGPLREAGALAPYLRPAVAMGTILPGTVIPSIQHP
ncbi:hypothetical protein M433DRAFT_9404 [Acidomyces richmondensis BFW]|nr:hypothetical protein M433DRAFT_9404 [Acidomyces richmondensis BFW]